MMRVRTSEREGKTKREDRTKKQNFPLLFSASIVDDEGNNKQEGEVRKKKREEYRQNLPLLFSASIVDDEGNNKQVVRTKSQNLPVNKREGGVSDSTL